MTLAEIADAAGLPARTIRFYIARGLLQGPVKGGRGAAYTAEHLARLEEIKRLQSGGRTLSDIARALGGESEAAAPPATAWWQFALGDDVIVSVKAGAAPWRMKQIRSALDAFARAVETGGNRKEQKEI